LAADGIGVLTTLDGIQHAGDVLDLAREMRLEQLWLPSAIAYTVNPETFVRDALRTHDVSPREFSPWLYGWDREHRRSAAYVVPTAIDSPFTDLEPHELLRALTAFRGALGLPFRRSPGATGTDLLREVRSDPGPASAELPEPAASGQQELDIAWCRDLTPHERALPFIHSFDANAQYLAACSAAVCGLGDPAHFKRPRFDAGTAGYWRATIEGERPAGLPDPFNVGPAVGYRERRRKGSTFIARWYSTATIHLALQLGMKVTISDAWLYPKSVRFLRPWYERLRTARGQLFELDDVGGQAALAALKNTYRVSLGWLAGSFHEKTDPLYRPQWRHAVIALARANLIRRLVKLQVQPFAIETDAIYFASGEAGPHSAVPDGLPVTHNLGHFKHAGRARMADFIPTHDAKRGALADPARLLVLNRLVKGETG
jgi:hypothetical protein